MILKDIIGGTFLQFVPKGVSVGEDPDPVNIVGPNFFPAGDTGVWLDFGDCPNGIIELKFKESQRLKHLAQGGSWEELRRRLIGATVKFNSYDVCEPFLRMALAVKGEMEDGTAAAPLRDLDPHIECWLNFQVREEAGTDLLIFAGYGKLRLDANPKWGDADPTLPAWQLEVIPTTIASVITNGIAPSGA